MTTKIYETERLYVKSFTKEDMEGNYKNWWTDADVTKHNSHGLFPYTKAQMEAFLARLESSDDIVWAVIAKKGKPILMKYEFNPNQIHIGNITLQNINWIYRSAEFAVVIGEKEYWSKGYTTEAAQLLISHGFGRLNLHRIWTGTAATNIGMQHVAIKLGMTHEGTFRQAMFLNGGYVDIIEYGILKEEWKNE